MYDFVIACEVSLGDHFIVEDRIVVNIAKADFRDENTTTIIIIIARCCR